MDFINEIKNWLELKIKLWTKKNQVVFRQGDIWWCSLGFNIGEEIFGKGKKFTRPVLIFKKFTANKNRHPAFRRESSGCPKFI